MSLVEHKCPNCGAKLNVLLNVKQSFCSYCGCVLSIQNDTASDLSNLISLIENNFNIKNYNDVIELSKKILESDCNNFYGWYYQTYSCFGFKELESVKNKKNQRPFDLKYKGIQALNTMSLSDCFSKIIKTAQCIEVVESEERQKELKMYFDLLNKVTCVLWKGLLNSLYLEEGYNSLVQNEKNLINFITNFESNLRDFSVYESDEFNKFITDFIYKYKKFSSRIFYRLKVKWLKERKLIKVLYKKYK